MTLKLWLKKDSSKRYKDMQKIHKQTWGESIGLLETMAERVRAERWGTSSVIGEVRASAVFGDLIENESRSETRSLRLRLRRRRTPAEYYRPKRHRRRRDPLQIVLSLCRQRRREQLGFVELGGNFGRFSPFVFFF